MNKQQRARQIIVYAILITSMCCIQVTFSNVFRLLGRTADLMLVFVALTGYLFGTKDGAVVGAIVGIFRDYFSGPVIRGFEREPIAPLGIGLLAFFYIGLLSSILFRRKFRSKYTLGVLQVVVISLIYYPLGHLLSWLYLSISGNLVEYYSFKYIALQSVLPQILVNVIAAIPILLILRFIGPYSKGVRSGLVDGYSLEERKWQSV